MGREKMSACHEWGQSKPSGKTRLELKEELL